MQGYQGVFERCEKKYMVTGAQYRELRLRLEPAMEEDRYGLHTICSLYFDTHDYRLIRASIEKPVYKEKLRLRSYGLPGPEDRVFLELKKKLQGVVYKRRVPMTLRQAGRYLRLGEHPGGESQILSEIDWFMEFYGHPLPKALIACDRVALRGREDGALRITFDHNLRWRDSMLDLSKGSWGSPLTEPGSILMEIKVLGAMPVWLARLLDELELYPRSFSKYGSCYSRHLIHQKGGIICA